MWDYDNSDALKALGVVSVGHRTLFKKFIKELRARHEDALSC